MSHVAPPQTPTQPRTVDAEDWDRTIHVLVGIRLDITPDDARRAHIMACLEGLSEHKTRHELEVIAKRLYNHQKMTQLFAPRVKNGHNKLLYLLCSCYLPGDQSPLSQRNSLKRVRTLDLKPLALWDLLYYAIVAEIRFMYDALKDAHGEDFELPECNTILHEAGPDATSDTKLPISAIGLAVLLESMWATVTDLRFLSTIDLAVRTRNLKEGKSRDTHGEDNEDLIGNLDDSSDHFWKTNTKARKHVHDATCDALGTAEGLIDTTDMTPDEINAMVWSMHSERNKLQTSMPKEDQNLLAKFRAELHEELALNRTKSSNTSAYCSCDPSCYCHDVCDLVANECSCAHSRGEVREMVEMQVKEQKDIFTKLGSSSALFPNHMLGAVSNDVAQMQVAAMAVPDPVRAQACFSNKEASDALDGLILDQHRKRSNTADSSLAYVPAYVPPPRTPSRHKKDAYPLGLYGGEGSGQRYPTFKSQIADPTPPPVNDYNSQIPVRKPVPRNFSKPVTSSSPAIQSSPSPNTHYGLPASESQTRIARSFPDTAHGSTRMPFLHDGDDDEDDSTAYTYLAQETSDSIRPFSDEPEMYNPQITTSNSTTQLLPAPRRPTITTSATSPAGPLSLPRSRTKILFSFGRSASPPAIDPNEPLPDFIAPKPAKVQRYVSAGGTAKLHERDEIAGPAFTPATNPSMPVMQKDEWMEKMKDPEFVRSYFGEEALSKMDSIDETRASMETPLGGKRERGDTGASGSSGRFSAKLKRVFSRKSSGCERATARAWGKFGGAGMAAERCFFVCGGGGWMEVVEYDLRRCER
ncbi:hypothetical protein LTR22_019178 [Elasticomyces elasticus]|nr:hypothetical protein LTR22_019178 [Elasticomyces elasticus]KAK4911592.1 hypothetical protein LTR49_019842 [Elasticomyces elasticus]